MAVGGLVRLYPPPRASPFACRRAPSGLAGAASIARPNSSSRSLALPPCQHDKLITDIDWAPNTNRIATCSQDRNAYVWTLVDGVWKPTLVLLRINRAAKAVKWSPQENKFAVTSASKVVSICYFEEENDWWVSKNVTKKHKSTILAVDWHPNNLQIATASSDFRARVISAFIKGHDPKGGDVTDNGTVMHEWQVQGWVHDIQFSPSGNQVAFVSHDSSFHVANLASGGELETVKLRDVPVVKLLWITESSIVGVGHDCNPYLFASGGGKWEMKGKVDKATTSEAKATGGVSAAFAKFQNQASRGQADADFALPTKHQNLISCIQPYTVSGDKVSVFTTSGLDGRMVYWDNVALLDAQMQALKV